MSRARRCFSTRVVSRNRGRRRRCSAIRARSAFASFWRATSSEEPSSFVRNGQQQHSKPEWRQVVKKFISAVFVAVLAVGATLGRSEEHTSELQSLMRISYAVFCLKKKKM